MFFICWCNFELSKYWVVPFSIHDTCTFYQVTDSPALSWLFLSSCPSFVDVSYLTNFVSSTNLDISVCCYSGWAIPRYSSSDMDALCFICFLYNGQTWTLVISGHCSFCLLISSLHATLSSTGFFLLPKKFLWDHKTVTLYARTETQILICPVLYAWGFYAVLRYIEIHP